MGNVDCVLRLVVGVLLLLLVAPSASGASFGIPGRRLPSRYKQRRVQRSDNFMEHLFSKSSAEYTFRLSDGDVVSCIPIEKQPALTYSKDPKFQLKPSMSPEAGTSTDNNLGTQTASQLFAKEIGACPEGQIPVRKTAGSGPGSTSADNSSLAEAATASAAQFVHEHAYTATPIAHPPSYKGTEAVLNVWQPFVEASDFSLAQLWVMNTGLLYPPGSINWALNTIEAGWQVYSDLYGDKYPRLFTYWTGDGYVKTGCYNLNQDCAAGSAGFVQVSNKVLIGGSISPPSTADSAQYEFKLRVFKDDDSGNWWLQFNDEYVGYWPRSLFHSLRDMSDLIQWGGEIFDVRGSSGQTTTDMGSGALSSSGFKKAAYQRNLQYVGTDNKSHDVHDLQAVTTNPSCYTVTPGSNRRWGTYFYYGGRC